MKNYKTYKIETSQTPKNKQASSVMMIYTGGTLGMVYDIKSKSLAPLDFEQIRVNMPEVERLDFDLTILALHQPIDSSNIKPEVWLELANIIKQNFEEFDAFVILHGTDTMAFTASALSFLLENLSKPVILTGAQLPIGVARTDARENLITALEIAASKIDGRPIVPEVAVYFNAHLLRGNRSKKQESSQFNAFHSENYPLLAEVGINIVYNFPYIRAYRPDLPLILHQNLDKNIIILKLFPGISQQVVHQMLNISGLKGVVLETYGAGNAPSDEWFIEELSQAIQKGVVIMNVSQCNGGRVMQGKYATSSKLQQIGVVSGSDITSEAAVTKMMYLFGLESNIEKIKFKLEQPLCGEMEE